MKYLYILFFNIFAFYGLGAFIFSDGGVIDGIRKTYEICELEYEKYQKEIDYENMKSKLNYLKSIRRPDINILAQNGRKMENTIIFKFSDKQSIIPDSDNSKKFQNKIYTDYNYVKTRILLFLGIILILIVSGNVVLLVNMEREK